MKLNKFFCVLLSVVVLAGFSSCGSDDDDYSAKDVEGLWAATDSKMIVSTSNARATEVINAFYAEYEEEVQQSYEFKTTGTYVDREYPSDPEPNTGTYRVHGQRLYLKESGDNTEEIYVISTLSKAKLKLTAGYNTDITLLAFFNEAGDALELDLLKAILEIEEVDIATVKLKGVRTEMTYAKTASPQ